MGSSKKNLLKKVENQKLDNKKFHKVNIKTQQDLENLKRKIEKMKVSFEITKKNIKKVALDFAIDYFKSKSNELSIIYTGETMKILNQYAILRDDSMKKDKKI